MQAGVVEVGSASQEVTFTTPFSYKPIVFTSLLNTALYSYARFSIDNIAASAFTINASDVGSDPNLDVGWLAIGTE